MKVLLVQFFLQRGREAQRCQVTPYVVNVGPAAAGVTDS